MYEPRFYRERTANNRLKRFNVTYKETDLLILAPLKLNELCFTMVRKLRKKLDLYLEENPLFLEAVKPLRPGPKAPREVLEMAQYSALMGVGPMAAVAGLFAEKTGQKVLEHTDEVIVENGGDIFVSVKEDCRVGVYAGRGSAFENRLALKIRAEETPLGISSSSGKMGPSLNFGEADSATVLSPSTLLADAAATAISNRIREDEDIQLALEWSKGFEDIKGVVIIKGDKVGFQGDIEIVKR